MPALLKATPVRYHLWLRRLGKMLLRYLDIILESEENEMPPREILMSIHEINVLLDKVDKWYKSHGEISWRKPYIK